MAKEQTYDLKTVAVIAIIAVVIGGLIGVFSAPTGAASNANAQGHRCEKSMVDGKEITKCDITRAVNTKFAVTATGSPGWQDCSQHAGGMVAANAYCWMIGYNGIEPTETSPCLYEDVRVNRYDADGYLIRQVGTNTGPGLALTEVLCRSD